MKLCEVRAFKNLWPDSLWFHFLGFKIYCLLLKDRFVEKETESEMFQQLAQAP